MRTGVLYLKSYRSPVRRGSRARSAEGQAAPAAAFRWGHPPPAIGVFAMPAQAASKPPVRTLTCETKAQI